MLNDEFVARLAEILKHTGLNAASFADKIGIQRSSISHLLSGRNKPSLDFILKILESFPELDLYYILTGKGKLVFQQNAFELPSSTPPLKQVADREKKLKNNNEIEKMIVLYKDGSFTEYFPR